MTNKKLKLQIDFRSGLPIYTQIVNQVQTQVVSDVLKPGDQLPTVRALAEDLRVNFNTVQEPIGYSMKNASSQPNRDAAHTSRRSRRPRSVND